MKKLIFLFLLIFAISNGQAQKIQSSNYNTSGYIKRDGTIQTSNYNIVGFF